MMARAKFLVVTILGAAVALPACSPSPLYVDRAEIGAYGEVPRDGRGEPMWGSIAPPPPVPETVPQPMPSMGPNHR